MMMIGWHSDTDDSGNFSEFLIMCPMRKPVTANITAVLQSQSG